MKRPFRTAAVAFGVTLLPMSAWCVQLPGTSQLPMSDVQLPVSSDAETDAPLVFGFTFPDGYLSAMSDNGKWALYRRPSYSEVDCLPQRMNLSTGKIETLPFDAGKYPGSLSVPLDITDDGLTIVGALDQMPAYFRDGEWHELPMPKGSRGYTGDVTSVTPDGRTMCGWVSKGFSSFHSIIWRDGEILPIGELPTYDEMFERHIIDEQDYTEHKLKGQTPNVAFFKISSDGKTILAGVDHNYPGWGCSYIVYHVDEGTYDWIADDKLAGGAGGYVDSAVMSHNGEWVSCNILSTQYNPDGSWDDKSTRAIYHVPTKTFTRGRGGSIIDNDGTCYNGSIPSPDGISVSLPMLLKQKYDIDFWRATGHSSGEGGFYFDVSADGRTLVGQNGTRLYAYSVTLPIPLKEASGGINLLSEYTTFPPSNVPMSALKEVMVRFTSSSSYVDGTEAVARISKDDGSVEEVKSVSVGSNSSGVWTISFPEQSLPAGAKCEITIPSGMFKGRNATSVSPEIAMSLRGRDAAPLSPLTVSPLEDSQVLELGVYNMISMMFDTMPLTTEVSAQLYEKGGSTPICPLTLVANGYEVSAYPPATRKLSKGKEYEVVIPAGALTDLVGNDPNDEIRLHYKGAFVPEGGKGDYLFYEDFESPNDALNSFLQYEGDHLTPVADMVDWGFDNDNTPWNFSVHDDDSYDYCAASHSRYFGGGRSDDWLVVPQLNIDSEWYRLSFKSQSHLFNKHDKLKVLVWRSDEVLGSLDSNVIEKMRAEGDVVYDEQQTPGNSETVLAGDWRENTIDLAPYAGSKIYIAFINENENQSAVFVDDIKVGSYGDYTVRSTTPTTVVDADEVAVSATVTLNADENGVVDREIKTLTAVWRTTDGSQEGETTIESPKPDADGVITINFDTPLRTEYGVVTDYTITVNVDGEKRTISSNVANLAFEIVRRVLVEEGTGSWCGFCPQGIIVLDYLDQVYGDRVVPVCVHNGDTYAYDSYDAFLALGGYPMGRVNRNPKVVAPIGVDPVSGAYTLSSAAGNETFLDMVESELALPAYASIDITGINLDDSGNLIVNMGARSPLTRDEVAYNILTIITEDGLKGAQNNYLSGTTDPLFGEWRNLPAVTAVEYADVARTVAGTSFYGESGLLPTSMKAGETYSVEVKTTVPGYINAAKSHIVAVLIDANTGRVVNATRTDLRNFTGVESVESCNQQFTVENGRVLFGGSAENVEVYTLTGLRVANEGLHGAVIVRVVTADGTVRSGKLKI